MTDEIEINQTWWSYDSDEGKFVGKPVPAIEEVYAKPAPDPVAEAERIWKLITEVGKSQWGG